MRNHLILIPAGLLLLAVAPLPYGYYTFLRIAVTAGAVAVAWASFQRTGTVSGWVVGMGLIAALFNPIIPVHLTREIWLPINLVAAGAFVARWFSYRSPETPRA